MKRTEVVTYLTKLLSTYEDCQLDETAADEILEGLEQLGMLPPEIRLKTPLGALSYLEVNEWEENANYDEAGYILGQGPDLTLNKAEVIE